MGRLIVEAYSKRGEHKRRRVQAFRKEEMQETRKSKGGREELTDTKKVEALSKEEYKRHRERESS